MSGSTRGPLITVDRLRTLGLGEQALKAALAAGLAWALGGLVPGAPPQPYLAPLTAMLTVQLTVAESVTGAVQRTIGATIGVLVAAVAGSSIGVNPITIALLVLVGQMIGAVLRLTLIGTSQVMVTALLVLTIGGTTTFNYGWARIAETIVGAVVGVGVNALLVPPSYLTAAESAKKALVQALVELLDDLASGLADGITAERAAAYLEQARSVVRDFESTRQLLQRAEDSLRFNLRARAERDTLDAIRSQLEVLERSAIQTRTVARTLDHAGTRGGFDWLAPSALGQPLAKLLRAAAALFDEFLSSGASTTANTEFAEQREAVLRLARTDSTHLTPEQWMQLAAILATVDRLAADVRRDAPADDDDD
ncbi:MAG TPA: FUSC family protein [Chloroflexota bacterium]|jgi:uncharacterized membrane protein YgaE (UPF0421/DUF939 family)|nr:FUSC family protein [Chloroflexota bacterium]